MSRTDANLASKKKGEEEMEWRVRESSHGYYAERGSFVGENVPSLIGAGYFMPAFIVSESMRFNDRKSAERYIQKRKAI